MMLKVPFIAVYIVFYCFSNFCFSTENIITFDVAKNKKTIINKATQHSSLFLLLPIPNQRVLLQSDFLLTVNKKPIAASFRVLNAWSTLNNEKFIRLLSIEVSSLADFSKPLSLSWVNSDKERAFQEVSLVDSSKVSQLVYPSKSWLLQSILLHPYQAVGSDWYTEPQKKYANYVTDQALLEANGYPAQQASQWLYDRPQAIYQLYLMTGQKEWLAKANELADFYINNIDENGIFILKKHFDPKMLMPKGVFYRYLLSGDVAAKKTLKKMFERSLDWDESYSLRRGFWTERNQAAALNVAVTYWELTSDARALKRINEIIDATVKMTFTPENDWPLRGCPQHSFKSHEGRGDHSPTCSPWMMALLSDALWRFYLLTEDTRAAALIDAFGDFILNYALYYGDDRVKNIVITKYIVSMENAKQEKLNQWTDPQHACDIAALLGKSAYIKQSNNQDNFLVKTLFNAFLEQCQESYTKLKNQQKNKQVNRYWILKPPRRFGWMYSTTSDLPWLANDLLGNF